MLGLTFDKLMVIAVIAAVLIGPKRLPAYASKLATLVKRFREFADTAQDRVKAELGDDAELLDWKALDPRQYDPRRIIREALTGDPPGKGTTTVAPPVDAVPVKAAPNKEVPEDATSDTSPPANRSAETRD